LLLILLLLLVLFLLLLLLVLIFLLFVVGLVLVLLVFVLLLLLLQLLQFFLYQIQIIFGVGVVRIELESAFVARHGLLPIGLLLRRLLFLLTDPVMRISKVVKRALLQLQIFRGQRGIEMLKGFVVKTGFKGRITCVEVQPRIVGSFLQQILVLMKSAFELMRAILL